MGKATYPDDIMKAANDAWMDLPEGFNCDPEAIPFFARAIMAERQRAVGICRYIEINSETLAENAGIRRKALEDALADIHWRRSALNSQTVVLDTAHDDGIYAICEDALRSLISKEGE